jgi:hypothetical protein
MDPLTLFALANGAVNAIKQGCKLYKEIKGAAGDIKGVLADLDDQFHNAHKDRPPTIAEKNQYIEEKNRIINLNKRDGETTNIYQEIGDQLGAYYDNYYKCMAIFEEEENRSHTEVYTGDESLGKRALKRVLMRKQLQQMDAEIRELMVYQCPPELGSLYTEVEKMMKEMGKEQAILIAQEMRQRIIDDRLRHKRRRKMFNKMACNSVVVIAILFSIFIFSWVIKERIERFPEYGNCIPPRGTWLYRQWTNTIWATCE